MIYQLPSCNFPETNRYYNVFQYMFILTKGKHKTFNPISDRINKTAGRKVSGTDRYSDGTTKPKSCLGNIIKPYGVRYNVWLISEGKRQHKHPASFPESLANDHILSWSNENDLVLDPFVGSGTTTIASKNLNRNFIGFENNPDYYKIAEERVRST